MLLRRGWRMALLHVVPLAVIDAVWYTVEHDATGGEAHLVVQRRRARGSSRASGPCSARSAATASWASPCSQCSSVGLVFAWWPLSRTELRRRASAPAALLVGGPDPLRSHQLAARVSPALRDDEPLREPRGGVHAARDRGCGRRDRETLAAHGGGRCSSRCCSSASSSTSDGSLARAISPTGSSRTTGRSCSAWRTRRSPNRCRGTCSRTTSCTTRAGSRSAIPRRPARKDGRLPHPPQLTDAEQGEIAVRLGVEQSTARRRPASTCGAYYKPLTIRPSKGPCTRSTRSWRSTTATRRSTIPCRAPCSSIRARAAS